MKKKNKTIKKLGIVALVAMMFLSASAWLTSRQTAAGVNKIKAGEASIRFANQANAITLTGNDSIPMTKDYAVANLTPYVFDIENDGSIALDYKISISEENYDSTFPDGKVNVVIAKINDVAEASTVLAAASVQKVAKNQVIDTNNDFVAHASQKYALIAYIDEATVNNDYLTKSITFKLEVNAVQAGVTNNILETTLSYASVSKSQIATSITAGGETKSVEVYNIEGDSKTELLNKLDESGLANSADVDALIEVKGEDYDGLNSTATFDLTGTANAGDTVVILHFNETSQEWEYIGTETVGDDNTVQGNFNSYSPVAFVVIKSGSGSGSGSGEGGSGEGGSGEGSGEGGSSEPEPAVLTLKLKGAYSDGTDFVALKEGLNHFSDNTKILGEVELLNSSDPVSDLGKISISFVSQFQFNHPQGASYTTGKQVTSAGTFAIGSLLQNPSDNEYYYSEDLNYVDSSDRVKVGYVFQTGFTAKVSYPLASAVVKQATVLYDGSPMRVVDANGVEMDEVFWIFVYDEKGTYYKADMPLHV